MDSEIRPSLSRNKLLARIMLPPLAAGVGLEPAAWATRLLTALVVAGGSNLLHDLWPSGQAARNE